MPVEGLKVVCRPTTHKPPTFSPAHAALSTGCHGHANPGTTQIYMHLHLSTTPPIASGRHSVLRSSRIAPAGMSHWRGALASADLPRPRRLAGGPYPRRPSSDLPLLDDEESAHPARHTRTGWHTRRIGTAERPQNAQKRLWKAKSNLTPRFCCVSGDPGRVSREIVDSLGLVEGLVVAVGVEGEFAD